MNKRDFINKESRVATLDKEFVNAIFAFYSESLTEICLASEGAIRRFYKFCSVLKLIEIPLFMHVTFEQRR